MKKSLIILKKLLEETRNKNVSWSQTNIVDQFEIKIGSGRITLDYNRPSDTQYGDLPYDYMVVFYNEKGAEIERISIVADDQNKETYELLKSLWGEVEDSYLKINETFDSMMRSLGIS